MNDDSTDAVVVEPAGATETETLVTARKPDVAEGNGFGKGGAEERKTQAPPKSIWREYFESAVVTVIMALFGMTFIVQAVKVPTGSMKNTIVIQDHLLVNKFIFGPHDYLSLPLFPQRTIRRGDVIVFKFPKDP